MVSTLKLAGLLLSYEADEPHVPEESFHYPDFTPDKVQDWLRGEHLGDCVKLPTRCCRCAAEEAIHKAVWLKTRMYTND